MKKFVLTLCLCILFMPFCCAKINETQKTKSRYLSKVQRYNAKFLFLYEQHLYDITSYRYNTLTKKARVDVFYRFNLPDDELNAGIINSPYDDNDIQYLIFSTIYDFKNGKTYVEYKGFVSGNWFAYDSNFDEGIDFEFREANVYYDNNKSIIPNLDKYIKDFLASTDKKTLRNTSYIIDIREDFQKEYNKKGIFFKRANKIFLPYYAFNENSNFSSNLNRKYRGFDICDYFGLRKIKDDEKEEFIKDMEEAVNEFLACREYLDKIYKQDLWLYKQFLKNKNNKSRNKRYIKKLWDDCGSYSCVDDIFYGAFLDVCKKYGILYRNFDDLIINYLIRYDITRVRELEDFLCRLYKQYDKILEIRTEIEDYNSKK